LFFASELLKFNFSPSNLFKNIYQTEIPTMRLKGYILQNFKVSVSGIGYIKLYSSILQKLNVEKKDAFEVINILSNIKHINIWVFFVESKDRIDVRIRSNRISINSVALEFGGGGHCYSSGLKIYSWAQSQEVLDKLESLIYS